MSRKKKKKKHGLPVKKKSTKAGIVSNRSSLDIEDAFNVAFQYYQNGQLEMADKLYKKILAVNPNHADALHLLGIIADQVGKYDISVGLIKKAIKIRPQKAIYHYSMGNALNGQGKTGEVLACLRKAIELNPDFAEAFNNMGVTLKAQGRSDEAITCFRKALEIKPQYAEAHNNMGNALKDEGGSDEAITSFRKATEIKPQYAEAHSNMGNALKDAGRSDEAITCFRKALKIKPDFAVVHNNLGIVYRNKCKLNEAIECYQKALHFKPDFAEAYNNLGNVYKDQGRLDDAIRCCREALRLKPDFPQAYNSLGNILKFQGKLDEAIECYQKALHFKPDFAEAYNNLGNVYRDQGRLDEAIGCCREALRLKPDFAEAYNVLGVVYRDQGKLAEAMECYHKALHLQPDFPDAHNNIGSVLKSQGRIAEAIECYRKALELKPDLTFIHSNLLLGLHYHDQFDPVQVFSEHQRWAEQHALPVETVIQSYLNNRSLDRRLRIGYVSPDFRTHSVACFIEALIASHDRTAVEVICYSDVTRPDSTTRRLKSLADCWRDIVGMTDQQGADLVRKDRIDILVDLSGHTAKNRMLLFAEKPAPVQATYLGYPNTTGLSTMDHRITDSWADPPGETDHLYTENLVRLPYGFLCYKPDEKAPPVAKLPASESGGITFGSFNYRAKITGEVVKLWSKILNSVADSRLVLKSNSLSDTGTQQLLRKMFVQNGISLGRIQLVGFIPSLIKHLELYNTIDIGLDTFPYNGTTTTCEALWMGVPVIVLAGRSHVSRVGVSLLSGIGLTDLIADSTEAYLEKAVKLADNLGHLQDLRKNSRDMMLDSPLTDAGRFICTLEKAYRQMWHRWCNQTNGSSPKELE